VSEEFSGALSYRMIIDHHFVGGGWRWELIHNIWNHTISPRVSTGSPRVSTGSGMD